MVAMTGDTASASLRIAQIFFMFCPPASLSTCVVTNTTEQSLNSFVGGYQGWSLSDSIIADLTHLAMSHISP
jgi:hypothetical protein